MSAAPEQNSSGQSGGGRHGGGQSGGGRNGAAAGTQLCSFDIGGDLYVLDIMRIREIVNPLPITPVRRASELVEGVIDLRGEIIPVVDLRRVLGLELGRDPRAKHVIVTVGGKVLGLVVDGVGRVLVADRSEIKPTPALTGTGARLLPGVLNRDGRLHLLLNLKALLEGDLPSPEEVARIRRRAEESR